MRYIGNAVAVNVARAIGQQLCDHTGLIVPVSALNAAERMVGCLQRGAVGMAKTSYASCDQVIFVDQVAECKSVFGRGAGQGPLWVDVRVTHGERLYECHHVNLPLHAAGNQTTKPRLVLLYRSQIQLHTGSSTT